MLKELQSLLVVERDNQEALKTKVPLAGGGVFRVLPPLYLCILPPLGWIAHMPIITIEFFSPPQNYIFDPTGVKFEIRTYPTGRHDWLQPLVAWHRSCKPLLPYFMYMYWQVHGKEVELERLKKQISEDRY